MSYSLATCQILHAKSYSHTEHAKSNSHVVYSTLTQVQHKKSNSHAEHINSNLCVVLDSDSSAAQV